MLSPSFLVTFSVLPSADSVQVSPLEGEIVAAFLPGEESAHCFYRASPTASHPVHADILSRFQAIISDEGNQGGTGPRSLSSISPPKVAMTGKQELQRQETK